LILALCAVLAPELYFRARIHPPNDPERFVFARPPLAHIQVSITRALAGLQPGATMFRTSALGLRADELDLGDRARYRILTLGDSVTECLLLDDEAAWPHRLQSELGTRTGRSVWVGNTAGSGELSLDYIVHIQKLVPQLAPQLVLIMPGGYELQASIEEKLFPMDLSKPAALEQYAARLYGPQNEQAAQNLAVLRPSYLWFSLRNYLAPEQLDMTAFYERMRARRAAHQKLTTLSGLDDALDVYKANLRAIVAAWRGLSPQPALVLLTRPFMWKPNMSAEEQQTLWGGYTCMDCDDPSYYDAAALAAGLTRFNQALLETCEAEKIPCFDLAARLPKNLTTFYDDAHLRAEGARQSAREIANFLVDQRLVH
jgi:lysophospholipase L1-like esterase